MVGATAGCRGGRLVVVVVVVCVCVCVCVLSFAVAVRRRFAFCATAHRLRARSLICEQRVPIAVPAPYTTDDGVRLSSSFFVVVFRDRRRGRRSRRSGRAWQRTPTT